MFKFTLDIDSSNDSVADVEGAKSEALRALDTLGFCLRNHTSDARYFQEYVVLRDVNGQRIGCAEFEFKLEIEEE